MKEVRPIWLIAIDILKDWTPVRATALPYVQAMKKIDKITDRYYHDSAYSVVSYFLANAGTWRGDTARLIKAELRSML